MDHHLPTCGSVGKNMLNNHKYIITNHGRFYEVTYRILWEKKVKKGSFEEVALKQNGEKVAGERKVGAGGGEG